MWRGGSVLEPKLSERTQTARLANNMATRAPKQWCLTKTETINSFENWKQNLIYTLSLDANFAPFLVEGASWLKKSRTEPLRGFTNDGDAIPAARRHTADQKVNLLELMLGQIANYCPIISRNTILKSSTSVEFIWNAIRLHFGFQATGAHFVDFNDIVLQAKDWWHLWKIAYLRPTAT